MIRINIDGEIHEFEELDLSWDNATPIDHAIATQNLLLFKEVLDKHQLDFVLIYGTLLGAIREKGFIEHDYDIDTTLFDEKQLIKLIPELKKAGLVLVRYTEQQKAYSFMKDGCYIDVYIPEKINGLAGLFYMKYCGRFFPKRFFKALTTIEFLGSQFKVPHNPEKLLQYFYGKNWRTPIKKKPGIVEPSWMRKIKRFFGIILPLQLVQRIRKALYKSAA